MTLSLTKEQINALKTQAHHLDPVIIIGQKGLTEAVLKEIEVALDAHELIKIKERSAERDDRKTLAEQLCEQLNAGLVGIIGKTIIVYRPSKKKSAKK